MVCVCHAAAALHSPFRPVPPPSGTRPDRMMEQVDFLRSDRTGSLSAIDSWQEESVVTIPSHSLRSAHHKMTVKGENSSPSGKGDTRSPSPYLGSVRLSPEKQEYYLPARNHSRSPHGKHQLPGLFQSLVPENRFLECILCWPEHQRFCHVVCSKDCWRV